MKPEEKKAKETFSRYVRIRDCVKTTGNSYYGQCITCGKVCAYEELHCGHFISGRGNSLFFDENNSNAQCAICNTSLDGNPEIYRMKMIRKHGIKEVERMEGLRHSPLKISASEFIILNKIYREKIKEYS